MTTGVKNVNRRGICRGVLLSTFLTIAGCTSVGPAYKTPDNLLLPGNFETESSQFSPAGISASQWWLAFEDPTLNILINKARKNNLDLRKGALRVLEARAIRGVAQSASLPGANLNTTVARGHASDNTLAFGKNTKDFRMGTDIGWELDFWGRIKRGIESSEAQLKAGTEDLKSLQIVIATEVANAYIQLRAAEIRLSLAEENVRVQNKLLFNTKAMFDQGGGTKLDVAQAEAIFADTQALVPTLQRQRTLARNGLAVLLATTGQAVDDLVTSSPSTIPKINSQIQLGVPAEVIRQRPDVLAAEFRAMSAAAQVGVAEADRLPNVFLAGSLLFQVTDGVPTIAGGDAGSSASDLFNADSAGFSFVPSVSLPIFDGGRRKNQALAADARYQAALEEFKQKVILAVNEVENAIASIETISRESEYLRTSVDAYVVAWETANTQYTEGDIAFTPVLDSLRQRVSQEQRLVMTDSAVATGYVELFRSLGGAWDDFDFQLLPQETIDQMQQRTDWDDKLGGSK